MTKNLNFGATVNNSNSSIIDIDDCSSTDAIEALLDRFPLCAEELLLLLEVFSEQQGSSSSSSCPQHHYPSCFLTESPLLTVLPDLLTIYHRALSSVFVITHNGDSIERDTFLEAICSLLGRRGERFLWDVLFDSFLSQENDGQVAGAAGGGGVEEACVEPLMTFLYRLAVVASRKSCDINHPLILQTRPSPQWIQALSAERGGPTVSRAVWKVWTADNQLHRCLAVVFHLVLKFQIKSSLPLEFPLHLISLEESIKLAAMGLGGPFHTVYDSDQHGLQFRIFQEALLSFQGPTVLLIRTTQGDCLGYYSRVPWRISAKWYSGSQQGGEEDDSFLFRLSPYWNCYRIQSPYDDNHDNNNISHMLYNHNNKHRVYHQYLNIDRTDTALRGLAIGGVAPDAPRLYLTESLEQCRCGVVDHTFVPGPLLSGCHSDDDNGLFFDVDFLHVLAVCTETEFQQGRERGGIQTAAREGARQRLAQVDRNQFLQDMGLLYCTHLFEHRQQARGRSDYVAHEDERKGYYIQGKGPSLSRHPENS